MRRLTTLLEPGSAGWLLRHELLLVWRSFGVRSRAMLALAAAFIAIEHVAGALMLSAGTLDAMLAHAPATLIVMSAFIELLVLSSAFGLAVRVFFERGDIESLLASPVPIATIYAVRAITVGAAAVGSVALFLLPLVNLAPFFGQWRKLAAWPALAALGLGCAAVAMAATLGLVRWLGLRRARVVAQLAGAFIGAALVIAMQVPQLLPRGARNPLVQWLRGEDAGWLGAASPLLWPVRAFMGEGLPLLAFVVAAVAAFAWAVKGTQAIFLRAMQDAPQASGATAGADQVRERPFRSGLARVVVVKELTLIVRDPALMAKTLLQLLYLVPLFIVMFRQAQPAQVLAAALVMLSCSLGGTLAWIAVSGEEASDLVASAPVSLERIRWLKVGAALLPVAIVVLPFIAGFATQSLRLAAVSAVFVSLALASSAVVQVWVTPLGGGRDVRQRYRQNPLVGIVETLSTFAWAFACYLALVPTRWFVAAAACGLIAPAMAWFSGRREP